MSHFPVTVTLPEFMDTVYGSDDLDGEHIHLALENKLRPFKEVGWGADTVPPDDVLHWVVREQWVEEGEIEHDRREYESLDALNEAEDDLPRLVDGGGEFGPTFE